MVEIARVWVFYEHGYLSEYESLYPDQLTNTKEEWILFNSD